MLYALNNNVLKSPLDMAPYLRALHAASNPPATPASPISPSSSRPSLAIAIPEDKGLLEKLEKRNEEELKKLDERLAEAEKTEGESEIADALKARATYLTRIGDKVCYNALL